MELKYFCEIYILSKYVKVFEIFRVNIIKISHGDTANRLFTARSTNKIQDLKNTRICTSYVCIILDKSNFTYRFKYICLMAAAEKSCSYDLQSALRIYRITLSSLNKARAIPIMDFEMIGKNRRKSRSSLRAFIFTLLPLSRGVEIFPFYIRSLHPFPLVPLSSVRGRSRVRRLFVFHRAGFTIESTIRESRLSIADFHGRGITVVDAGRRISGARGRTKVGGRTRRGGKGRVDVPLDYL